MDKQSKKEKELFKCAADIHKEVRHWKETKKDGCYDPGWPDGVNLNLIRNHVIYYKRKIMELCAEMMMDIPVEYYIPTPPYTDSNYFARPESERARRIMSTPGWQCANIECPEDKYDEAQMSLF